ncbi:MAG: hypothetical protein WBQ34_10225 [Candidatus Acidiferrales bacterium]
MNDADKKLLALAEKATPEWEVVLHDDPRGQPVPFYVGLIATFEYCGRYIAVVAKGGYVPKEQWEANARYAAAAANAVPKLIAENERLRKHIKAAHAICEVVACKDEPVGRAAQRWLTADDAAAKESSHE